MSSSRFSATYAATVPSAGTLSFNDGNYDGRLGWREVTAAGGATNIVRSTVPSTSPSRHLTAYPDDLLESPLDVTSATVEYAPGEGTLPGATPPESRNESGLALTGDGFTALATRQGTGLMVVAVLLAIAFGALHSLGPGHGKTVMAAYLVGSGGRIRHSVGVAAAIAAMHTASVLALGLIVLSAQRVFPPEVVYPWLALVSGVIALTLGTTLLISRVRARRASAESTHGHTHLIEPGWSRGRMAGLALAGGILPSPTALLVLLGSVALGRTAFGLALIAGFSVGLAVALIGIGVLTLRTRDLVVRRSSTWLGRLIPVVSAAIVVVLGAALTFGGLTQI
jgi:nickel/cobalt transporter (NicO) family protein